MSRPVNANLGDICYRATSTLGWLRIRRYFARDGWVLRRARWRPLIPLRQAKFAVEIERDGRRLRGVARAGGYWTGPVWSNMVEVELDDH